MKISKKGKQAPIIERITYHHNVKREDDSIGDYIIVDFIGDYKEQVINVNTKVDVNALDKKIQIKGIKDSDVVPIYNIKEQEGYIEEPFLSKTNKRV